MHRDHLFMIAGIIAVVVCGLIISLSAALIHAPAPTPSHRVPPPPIILTQPQRSMCVAPAPWSNGDNPGFMDCGWFPDGWEQRDA